MPMLYTYNKGEFIVEPEEGASMGYVQLYWHIIDLWMPLLGTECVGVYSMLVRLGGKKGETNGNTLKFLARACRIGDKKLRQYCDILKEFGFIKMYTPTEEKRGSGYRTQFRIIKPPERVTPLHIEFAKQKGYVPKDFVYHPFTHWLVKNLNDRVNRPDWDTTEFDLSSNNDRPTSADDSISGQTTTALASDGDFNVDTDVDSNVLNFSKEKLPGKNAGSPSNENQEPKETETHFNNEYGYSPIEFWFYKVKAGSERLSNYQRKQLNAPNDYSDPISKQQIENGPSVNELYKDDPAYIKWLAEEVLPSIKRENGGNKYYKPFGRDLLRQMRNLHWFYKWKVEQGYRFKPLPKIISSI